MTNQSQSNDQPGGTSRAQPSSDSLLRPFPHPANSKPLVQLYRLIRRMPLAQSRELIVQLYMELSENIEAYWGPPDAWHNLSIQASRVGEDEAEYTFWLAGLHAWPNDVDLLCDVLAEYTSPGTQHYSPNLATQTWEILTSLPREKTGPYWRFWVFGANYFAEILREPQRSLDLLDEGLLNVKRDGIVNILRSYRTILVDQTPRKRIGPRQLEEYQTETIKLLEDRYRLGIQLGVENGYTLATNLAKLFQERAASRAATSTAPSSSSAGPLDARTVQQLVSDDLEKALTYLKIAEALYTGDPQQGVDDIYAPRIRILMAQGQYGDALRLLQSLPEEAQNDPSMATMRRLATLSTGGKLDDTAERGRNDILAELFDGEGADLERLVRANPIVRQTIVEVIRRLNEESDS